MPEISTEVVALLHYLAPGFLVTWLYFGLTSHEKPSQFDRTVQALIYTAIVHALVAAERQVASWIGEWHTFGEWDKDSDLIAAVISALTIGLVVATTANHDLVHVVLRKLRVTHRTSHPSEWFGAFSETSQTVVLHLKDETQVHGWPSMWPSHAERGHFFITGATRRARGTDIVTSSHEALMINVVDVTLVEFPARKERT
jgi:hypothetical protein